MTKIALAAALALYSLTGIASAAADSLPSRAVTAFGVVIASQGDAALVKIRRELQESARDAMKPFLPAAQNAPEQTQPADTSVARQ